MLVSKLSRSSRSLRPPSSSSSSSSSSSICQNLLHCGNRRSPSIIIPGGGGSSQVGFVRSYLTSIRAANYTVSAAKTQLNPRRFQRFFSTVPNKKSRAERVRAVLFGKTAKATVGGFAILIVLCTGLAVFVACKDDPVLGLLCVLFILWLLIPTSTSSKTSEVKELPAPAAVVSVRDSCAEAEQKQQPTSSGQLVCDNCGAKGHSKPNCPSPRYVYY